MAHWGTQLLFNYLPGGQTLDLSPDGRILCFVALLSAAAAVCIGLIPSLRVSGLALMGVLKSQGQSVTGGSQRVGKVLVTGQIALSVCLLAGAGLFVRTLENLKNVDLGFRRDDLLLVNVGVDKHYTDVRRTAVIDQVLAGLAAMPGVRSATVSLGGLLDCRSCRPSRLTGATCRRTTRSRRPTSPLSGRGTSGRWERRSCGDASSTTWSAWRRRMPRGPPMPMRPRPIPRLRPP